MNYVDPVRDNASVVYDDVLYEYQYYRAPTSISGVTDESYGNWDAGTTYGVGDYAIVPELHAVFRSTLDGNTGKFPAAFPNDWVRWSPVNSYSMLSVDEFIGASTKGTDVVLDFDFSGMTAFAVVNCDFDTLVITQTDNVTGEVLYEEEVSGEGTGANSYYEYFYLPFRRITRLYRDNLVWSSDCTLRLAFTGNVSIGVVVMGVVREAGCTMYGTSLTIVDSSTIVKSEITGYRTVLRYGTVRELDVRVLFDTDSFNDLATAADSLVGRNVLFVPTTKDSFSEMITIGYAENFPIPVDNPSKIESEIKIIGVI